MNHKRKRSIKHALAMLTIEEAATELAITPGMVRHRMRNGTLPYLCLGRTGDQLRLIRCELKTYAKRHRWELRWLQIVSTVVALVPAVRTVR
ncbi:hypothetical protein [Fuerstiella marisgermanici]|uniref:Helix-turn-helix domain-containing protein n=1 Tax=Fuerstiella marisgermanici TaxID=1891926 RepID=A0A1P8WKF9_9PLAN|nr:hypothetical protein [Fuerstiella marisgermanici]APZ94552.1 hypothetical protein Fuma_04184 [Fuerstiella marisgermanici]